MLLPEFNLQFVNNLFCGGSTAANQARSPGCLGFKLSGQNTGSTA
jgi:hypothetical protein